MIPLPFILNLLLLERLSPGSIGRFDQSELCLFEAKRRLLSLLYQPIQVRCLLWYPYPPNRFAEDPFKPIFVKILPRNVHVQDSPRRQTVRIVRREEIGLTEIDVVYTFSRDHVKNEGEVDPRQQGVGIQSFAAHDISQGQAVKLCVPCTTSSMQWEQNGP